MHNLVLILFCSAHVFGATSAVAVAAEKVSADDCVPDVSNIWIGARASCTFEKRIDFREDRFPTKIPYVTCNCPENYCSYKGDFKCVEVKSRFEVVYREGTGWSNPTEIELPTSCACVTPMVAPVTRSTRPKDPDVSAATLEMPVSQSTVRDHSEGIDRCARTCISRCSDVWNHSEGIYSCVKTCMSRCDVAHQGTERR